ncbi:hypothetical protein OM076_41620, partial [Solirubrobacter ginsenosidimutans]
QGARVPAPAAAGPGQGARGAAPAVTGPGRGARGPAPAVSGPAPGPDGPATHPTRVPAADAPLPVVEMALGAGGLAAALGAAVSREGVAPPQRERAEEPPPEPARSPTPPSWHDDDLEFEFLRHYGRSGGRA